MGAIEAAKGRNIYAIGCDSDQNSLAPDTVVTSGVSDTPLGMETMIEYILNGKFKPEYYDLGITEGVVYLAPYHGFENKLSPEIKAKIEQVTNDIKSGKLDVHALKD